MKHSVVIIQKQKISADNFYLYLVRDIKPPNNQSCFPQFFPRIFVSWAVEKENKLYIGHKTDKKKLFWTKTRFFILFQLLKLRKIHGKNWGKQNWFFGGLMSRTRYSIVTYTIFTPS